jgi:hypothetical protein
MLVVIIVGFQFVLRTAQKEKAKVLAAENT